MKTCTKCKIEKSVAEFSKQKGRKDGLYSQCKACNAADTRASRAADPEKYRARQRAAYAADPEKFLACNRASRKANAPDPEKERARGRANYAADPEKHRARKREARAANPEKDRARGRAKQKANPEKYAASAAKRRATKLQATPAWADPLAIKSIYARASEAGLHVDHVVPLKSKLVCGLHVEHNLRPLAAGPNRSKGNRHWPDMPHSIGAAA